MTTPNKQPPTGSPVCKSDTLVLPDTDLAAHAGEQIFGVSRYSEEDPDPVAVPSQSQYQFALAMRAAEELCGGVEETAKQIARTRFNVALMAFEEQSTKGDVKSGFETNADGIRVTEQKLAHAGVIMNDEEKKEKFFAGFHVLDAV